jgi:hypothetical protein
MKFKQGEDTWITSLIQLLSGRAMRASLGCIILRGTTQCWESLETGVPTKSYATEKLYVDICHSGRHFLTREQYREYPHTRTFCPFSSSINPNPNQKLYKE